MVLGRAYQPPQRRPMDHACYHLETIWQEKTTRETSQAVKRRHGQIERHDLAEDSTRQGNLETACWGLRPTTGHYDCPMMMMMMVFVESGEPVSIIQPGHHHHHHHRVAPLSGAGTSNGTLFLTNNRCVYSNETNSQRNRHSELISGRCTKSWARIHTKSMLCCRKIKDQNCLHSVRFCSHCREIWRSCTLSGAHGNSVRLGRLVWILVARPDSSRFNEEPCRKRCH